jgi:hypothetical protein
MLKRAPIGWNQEHHDVLEDGRWSKDRRQQVQRCRKIRLYVLDAAVVAARPHPWSTPWPDRHQEDAAHYDAASGRCRLSKK